MKIEEKIKGMFRAVFEPRDEFIKLSKSSQDLLLGCLQDDIIEGFEALERDYLKLKKRSEMKKKKKCLNCGTKLKPVKDSIAKKYTGYLWWCPKCKLNISWG